MKPNTLFRRFALPLALAALAFTAFADVPGDIDRNGTIRGLRKNPANTLVPNPGTQEQELANITFPAPYNVFEFPVTCMACHGGTVDLAASHSGNWAGSVMASSIRDPIFRANQQMVNQVGKDLGAGDGTGNICIRCHSPNAWLSGRTDPKLAGHGDGSNLMHSILASTDDEGVQCETCHRAIGNVTMKRADLDQNDSVWNMLAGIADWPHAGNPYPQGPAVGNVFGDTSLMFNDGMTYMGKYAGSADIYFSDKPVRDPATGQMTGYTGQTYGVYPPGFPKVGQPARNPDGSVPLHFEVHIGPPLDPNGQPDYQNQAISLEHPTTDTAVQHMNAQFQRKQYVRSPEMCGSCHDLTVPILNHGMPEQRTYSEWLNSQYSREGLPGYTRCQDCHLPTMRHEYADDAQVSLNPDPVLAGWFPYGKDRNPNGGTAFHKMAGANTDLPEMMKILYPEVDLQVIGAETGIDPRIFPGMLSDRSPMWERARRNALVSMYDGLKLEMTQAPTLVQDLGDGTAQYEMKVKATNMSGHRIPTGYPDGRRFWIEVKVEDPSGATVYESGFYDGGGEANSHELYTDSTKTQLAKRALVPVIDESDNRVMIYEKVTATCTRDSGGAITGCSPSPVLTNDVIVFDNRIPPAGFSNSENQRLGMRFYAYSEPNYVPSETTTRYADGVNFDEVTYRFVAPANVALRARAEAKWQTHNREFMEHLKNGHADTTKFNYRPEGPPSIYAVNYPLEPNYLGDVIGIEDRVDLDGAPLTDNWGGIAYAAWAETGYGKPNVVAAADTAAATVPAATTVTAQAIDTFTVRVDWTPVAGAEGYEVWMRIGLGVDTFDGTTITADWDKISVAGKNETFIVNEAVNIGRTYGFKVVPFNGKGRGPDSNIYQVQTTTDLPLDPIDLRVIFTTETTVELAWFDQADNETGFIIERQDVPATGPFVEVARIPSPNGAGTGGVSFVDTGLVPGRTYNYQVAAYSVAGPSLFTLPVQATTIGLPGAPSALAATAANAQRIELGWTAATGKVDGYKIERSTAGGLGPFTLIATIAPAVAYADTPVLPNTDYWYRIWAFNGGGNGPESNVAFAKTPDVSPAAPTALVATAIDFHDVQLTWTDNAINENGFEIQRATGPANDPALAWATVATVGANVTTFNDTAVDGDTIYSYRVRATHPSAAIPPSDFSNVAQVQTPGAPPAAPTDLKFTIAQPTALVMTWKDNSQNELGFKIERSTNGTTFVEIATVGPNVTVYRDAGLARRRTYWYRVRAFNSGGNSDYSNTASKSTR